MFQSLNEDLREAQKLWRVVISIAITDMKARYRRTVLGPLWIVIGLALARWD